MEDPSLEFVPPKKEEEQDDIAETISEVPKTETRKRNISTCQRHDLSMRYATIGLSIQSKLKHELIPELENDKDWRQRLCWKYECDVLGPGGFVYRCIYDAMRAEKMRFMVDQLEIHTFLDFIHKTHSTNHPRDVVTVTDENFLSQNNLTLNVAVWEIVRRKLLYGYIRQRIRIDPTFCRILTILDDRCITPILFYPHSTPDTYYYGKLNRSEIDTTYQKTTLRKRAKIDVDASVVRNEIVSLETQHAIIGRNMYGELLLQAIRDHRLHITGHTLNLRASRKLNSNKVHVTVPLYYNGHNIVQNNQPTETVDDLLENLFPTSPHSPWKEKHPPHLTTSAISTLSTSNENLEPSTLPPSSPTSTFSTITSSGSIIY